jgi:hypothetical protein
MFPWFHSSLVKKDPYPPDSMHGPCQSGRLFETNGLWKSRRVAAETAGRLGGMLCRAVIARSAGPVKSLETLG